MLKHVLVTLLLAQDPVSVVFDMSGSRVLCMLGGPLLTVCIADTASSLMFFTESSLPCICPPWSRTITEGAGDVQLAQASPHLSGDLRPEGLRVLDHPELYNKTLSEGKEKERTEGR